MAAFQSEARVAMETPARYLAQLCKHFQHKLAVSLAATTGEIAFEGGACRLEATHDALVMRRDAVDAERGALLEEVLARHLLRFAFRTPPGIRWIRS